MIWQEARQKFSEQWLLVEAIQAHSEANQRLLDQISIVGLFRGSGKAMKHYLQAHHESPDRESYVLRTSREKSAIEERRWLEIRQ